MKFLNLIDGADKLVEDTSNRLVSDTEKSTWNNSVVVTGDTMEGALIAQTNTNYSTAQMRNVIISTGDATGGNNGDIWIKYIP